MQQYTVPLPGRSPLKKAPEFANIVDTDWYKLDIKLDRVPTAQDEYHLQLKRWTPEVGWVNMQLFMTETELARFRRTLGITPPK
jgi:hypothetical protein